MSVLQKLYDKSAAIVNNLDETAFAAERRYWSQKPCNNLDGAKATAATAASMSLGAVCRRAKIAADRAGRPLDTSKLKR